MQKVIEKLKVLKEMLQNTNYKNLERNLRAIDQICLTLEEEVFRTKGKYEHLHNTLMMHNQSSLSQIENLKDTIQKTKEIIQIADAALNEIRATKEEFQKRVDLMHMKADYLKG